VRRRRSRPLGTEAVAQTNGVVHGSKDLSHGQEMTSQEARWRPAGPKREQIVSARASRLGGGYRHFPAPRVCATASTKSRRPIQPRARFCFGLFAAVSTNRIGPSDTAGLERTHPRRGRRRSDRLRLPSSFLSASLSGFDLTIGDASSRGLQYRAERSRTPGARPKRSDVGRGGHRRIPLGDAESARAEAEVFEFVQHGISLGAVRGSPRPVSLSKARRGSSVISCS
jgi:hypothetical protein